MKIGNCKVTKKKTPLQIYLLPNTAIPILYIVTLKF